jgi:hypothetical protein
VSALAVQLLSNSSPPRPPCYAITSTGETADAPERLGAPTVARVRAASEVCPDIIEP